MSGVSPANMIPMKQTEMIRGKRLIKPRYEHHDHRFSEVFNSILNEPKKFIKNNQSELWASHDTDPNFQKQQFSIHKELQKTM